MADPEVFYRRYDRADLAEDIARMAREERAVRGECIVTVLRPRPAAIWMLPPSPPPAAATRRPTRRQRIAEYVAVIGTLALSFAAFCVACDAVATLCAAWPLIREGLPWPR